MTQICFLYLLLPFQLVKVPDGTDCKAASLTPQTGFPRNGVTLPAVRMHLLVEELSKKSASNKRLGFDSNGSRVLLSAESQATNGGRTFSWGPGLMRAAPGHYMLCSSGETGFRALESGSFSRANLEIACLRLVWQRHCRKLWRGWAIHCSCWRHPRGHEPRAESSAGKRRADKGLDLFTFHFSAEEVSVREPARGRRRSLQKSLTLMCLLPRLLQENPERSWDSELSLLLAVPLPALFFGAAPGLLTRLL